MGRSSKLQVTDNAGGTSYRLSKNTMNSTAAPTPMTVQCRYPRCAGTAGTGGGGSFDGAVISGRLRRGHRRRRADALGEIAEELIGGVLVRAGDQGTPNRGDRSA